MHAAGIPWQMGATSSEVGHYGSGEVAHTVTLASDYFIGVFEVTQCQWNFFPGKATMKFQVEGSMRPAECVGVPDIRENNTWSAQDAYRYPYSPNPNSYVGKLRTHSGIAFDLPGEAQWEFAARGGYGNGYWGTGSAITSSTTDENLPGRYKFNQATSGNTSDLTAQGPSNCTAVVGSYAPNGYGLYDVAGNVSEWCLDWYQADISGYADGRVNVSADGKSLYDGTTGTTHVTRGGNWVNAASDCRPAARGQAGDATGGGMWKSYIGFRLACPVVIP